MRATERIGQVLRLFTQRAPEWNTAEVARAIGVANSSAHELLNGLAETGLLHKLAPGRFRLGPMVNALAQVLSNTDPVIEAARPVVADVATRYGETSHAVELLGTRLLSLTSQEGASTVRIARELVSADVPIHAVAPGKLLLAQLPVSELLPRLQSLELTAITAATVVQRSRLREELTRLREEGYGDEVGQFDPDMASTAASIRNHTGATVAAFALFVPAGRFSTQPRAYRSVTLEAAARVSVRLGWNAPAGGTVRFAPSPGATALPETAR